MQWQSSPSCHRLYPYSLYLTACLGCSWVVQACIVWLVWHGSVDMYTLHQIGTDVRQGCFCCYWLSRLGARDRGCVQCATSDCFMGAHSLTQSPAAPHKSLLGTFTTSQTAISGTHHSILAVVIPCCCLCDCRCRCRHECHTQQLPLCLQVQMQARVQPHSRWSCHQCASPATPLTAPQTLSLHCMLTATKTEARILSHHCMPTVTKPEANCAAACQLLPSCDSLRCMKLGVHRLKNSSMNCASLKRTSLKFKALSLPHSNIRQCKPGVMVEGLHKSELRVKRG